MPTAQELNLSPGDRLIFPTDSGCADIVDIIAESVRTSEPLKAGQQERIRMAGCVTVEVLAVNDRSFGLGTMVRYLGDSPDGTKKAGDTQHIHSRYDCFMPASWYKNE